MNLQKGKLLTVCKSILISVLIISGSVSIPILIRPFYYIHIKAMNFAAEAGVSAEQIKQAYNEVMDYCIGLQPEFSAGVFSFSESGAAHFKDVRALFIFDLFCTVFSLSLLLIICFLCRKRGITEYRIQNKGSLFYGSSITLMLFSVIGAFAAFDFYRAFTIFHRIFFPGKENWEFSCETDPIINVLPQTFFMNCAILILVTAVLSCILCIIFDRKQIAFNQDGTDLQTDAV